MALAPRRGVVKESLPPPPARRSPRGQSWVTFSLFPASPPPKYTQLLLHPEAHPDGGLGLMDRRLLENQRAAIFEMLKDVSFGGGKTAGARGGGARDERG